MDSEASTSSGAGSKRPRNNTKRRVPKPHQGSDHEQLNHVALGASPPGYEGEPLGSGDESEESSPSRTPRAKGKTKGARRRKASASPVMIEDIIEGFAITSFRTREDLEMQTQFDLETSRIMTQGYTLTSVPSTPTTPQTAPLSMGFPAVSTEPSITASSTTPPVNLVMEDPSLDTIAPSVVTPTTKPAPVAATPDVVVDNMECGLPDAGSQTNMSKTPVLADKVKKEVVKKAKKCLSVDQLTSGGNGSIKDNKVQTSHSTLPVKKSNSNSGLKGNAKCSPSAAAAAVTAINCIKNSKLLDTKAAILPLTADNPDSLGPQTCSNNTKPIISLDQHLPAVTTDITVKKELQIDSDTKQEVHVTANVHSHTHNNNNHKLKSPAAHSNKDSKPSNFARENIIIKTEKSHNSHIKHSHLLLPPCGINKDGKPLPREIVDSPSLGRSHQIIAEEPLRQNGQSVSSLSLSSVASDRSSSRDRLSDAGSSGRGYICDSESEIDSKASDAGSDTLFNTNPSKNREPGVIPPSLRNGTIHMVPSPISHHSSHFTSNPHGLGPLKIPAATTASLTAVTVTTTTTSVTALTATTPATATTAVPITKTTYSSAYMNSTSKSHSKLPKSSLSSASLSSSALSSSASSSHTPRSHTPVHREQPRPIPGLSGTRVPDHRIPDHRIPDHRAPDHRVPDHRVPDHRVPEREPDHREVTPLRPYSRGPGWHSTSSLTPSQLPHSSPHISVAVVGTPSASLSIPGQHHPSHTPVAPLQHHHAALLPPPPHHHSTPGTHPGVPAHSMFAPPIAPPGSVLTSTALPVHNPLTVDPLTSSLGANPDILGRAHPERFLDNHLRLPGSYLASSYHQHHHNHQHMHHYGGPFPAPGSGLLLGPSGSAPQLLEKFGAKIESPLYRPGLSSIPGPLGLSPMLHPPPGLPSAPPLGSSLHGAFQPKVSKSGGSSGLHTSPMLLPLSRDKPQGPSVTPIKKSGKWCAAHVRIAWEIHIHQQKHSEGSRGGETKPSDLLRPPSHLMSGGGLHRPDHGPMALLGPQNNRSPFETAHPGHHSALFNPSHLGSSPFPRPSPYPGLAGLSTGGFGGLGNIGSSMYPGREMPSMPGMTSPHEWNRLHRTPPSFPTPPAWPPKSDLDREREKERERERELEREREREKDARERERERDKMRERERSMSRESHHNHREDIHSREREGSQSKDLNHRERDRDRIIRDKEHDLIMKRSPSREAERRSYDDRKRDSHRVLERSRSRSPLHNGPDSHHKTDGSPYPRSSPQVRPVDIKVKEEKKDEVMLIEDSKDRRTVDMRQDLLHKMASDSRNSMLLPPHSLASLYSHAAAERSRHMSPYDRPIAGQHPALWHPFERTAMEMNHRSDIEREREQLLRRMTNPLGLPVSSAHPLGLFEAEKFREQQELLLRDQAFRDRDRLAVMEREHRERVLASITSHMDMDRGAKVPPPLRHAAESYHPAFGGSGVPNNSYHPSAASRPPSNSSYHHPSGASRPPSSPVVINHNSNTSSSKSNSPSVVGAPPPLIPSSATLNHSNGSPTPNNKVKPPTPLISSMAGLDTNSKDKLEVNSNGLDSESQAR